MSYKGLYYIAREIYLACGTHEIGLQDGADFGPDKAKRQSLTRGANEQPQWS